MAYEYKTKRMVEFADTDMAGILHFSNYFRFMESVEHAFFRSLGLSVHPHSETGIWGWARGEAECRYERPLRYEETVDLHLRVADKRSKSITYEVTFLLDGERVAFGSMTVICVARGDADGVLRSMTIPPEVADLIEVAPADAD
ncbi:MAG: acyl-CoA thioesterase [Planctomycetota bacterium]|jgi:YbgC/YbaW family acyl-CoA thioester hydrolase